MAPRLNLACDPTPLLQLSEALRDAKLGLLKDLKSDSPEDAALADQLVKELKAEAPAYLPLLLEIMRRCVNTVCPGLRARHVKLGRCWL